MNTENKNMEYWNRLKRIDPAGLKTIKGGRLTGFTDVNPQFRYELMTDVFGVCGIGWKYTIDKLWSEPASEGQVFCFAMVSVYIRTPLIDCGEGIPLVGGEWSAPIPASGGSMLVEKETRGLHSSDEGYKMATTDALGTAMKMLGVASEIYSGRWDGTKYKDKPEEKLASFKTIIQNDLEDTKPEDVIRLQGVADKLTVLFNNEDYEAAIVLIKDNTNGGDPTEVNALCALGDSAQWKKLKTYRLAKKASDTKIAQAEAVRKMNERPALGGNPDFD